MWESARDFESSRVVFEWGQVILRVLFVQCNRGKIDVQKVKTNLGKRSSVKNRKEVNE